MKQYKLYEYYIEEDIGGTMASTLMEYIEDEKTGTVYYNLNGTGWKHDAAIALFKGDKNLKFVKRLTKKQVESELFLDIM